MSFAKGQQVRGVVTGKFVVVKCEVRKIDGVEVVQLDVLDVKHYLTTNHDVMASLVGKKFIIDDSIG